MNIYTSVLLVIAVISLTPSNIEGRRKITIRKCCPSDQVIDIRQMKCRDSGENKWTPWFYKVNDDSETGRNQQGGSDQYEILTQIPSCPGGLGVHVLPLRGLPGLNIPEAQ